MLVGLSGGIFGGGSDLVARSPAPVVGLPPNQPRFGEFKGRTDIDAPWENLDKVPMLRKGAGANVEVSRESLS